MFVKISNVQFPSGVLRKRSCKTGNNTAKVLEQLNDATRLLRRSSSSRNARSPAGDRRNDGIIKFYAKMGRFLIALLTVRILNLSFHECYVIFNQCCCFCGGEDYTNSKVYEGKSNKSANYFFTTQWTFLRTAVLMGSAKMQIAIIGTYSFNKK